ncbi:MAG: TlpA family protein disulfide reductase [Imperialibacter sp.]|uniref:TlpA family protein disulfide reductase n=1 Tax=Imperialibacter sp. TaxID=2038411 RepID=UPI003A87ADC2
MKLKAMKDMIRIKIVVVIVAIFQIGCAQEERQFSISGTISNYPNEFAFFVRDTVGYGLSTVIDTLRINEKGEFAITIGRLNINSLLVFDGKKQLRVTIPKALTKPVNFTIDYLKRDSIAVTGEQADFVRFYIDQRKYWIDIDREMAAKFPEFASNDLRSSIYHAVQDTITELRIQYLDDYFKDSHLPNQENFISLERSDLMYTAMHFRMSGQPDDIVKQFRFYQEPDESQKTQMIYSDQVDLSDTSAFAALYYREFANFFIPAVVRFENPDIYFSPKNNLEKGMEIIDRYYISPEASRLQKIIYVNDLMVKAQRQKGEVDVSRFQKAIQELAGDGSQDVYIYVLQSNLLQLAEVASKFSKGAPAPNFRLSNVDGAHLELADFKNKTILIDVWASWCGPCFSSFPKWNSMVEKYLESDSIEFLSVSIDEDQSKWIDALGKRDLRGMALYACADGFKSPFARDYQISAIPQYISIDGQGNILAVTPFIEDFKKILDGR